MAQIVKELRVDVSQPNVFQAIVAKQHDSNSRFLKITLVDFGVKVEVPNTAKVTINANRPDGASESFKGEANNDGTITVPLAQWMLDIDGEVKCDVSVTNTEDNKRLTSTDFWLEVQKAANPNASIPLDPDGEILIIKPVTEINGNSKDTDYPSAKAVYSYGQDILADTKVTATASGKAITIDSANAPLQNLKLYGKTTQNGTPTPDAPVPLVSVGDNGSLEVGVYGKNLLEITATTQTINGVTFTVNADKSVKVDGKASETAIFSLNTEMKLKAGEHILSGGVSGGGYGTYKLDVLNADGSVLRADYDAEGKFTLSNDITSRGARIVVYGGVTVNNLTFYPMLRLANITDSTYEPFTKQSLTFTNTLRGIGEIKDEVDFARGVTTQRFGIVDLGTLNWIVTGSRFQAQPLNAKRVDAWSLANLLCSHYSVDYAQNTWSEVDDKRISINQGGYIHIVDKDYTDVTAFKTAMSGVYLVYELAEPIETPISETELNAYRQLMTNKGTTTILSEAEAEVDYYINKPNAQAIGNIHSQVNKEYFKLQQAIISTGGSTL